MAIHHPGVDIGARADGVPNGHAAPSRTSGGTPRCSPEREQPNSLGQQTAINPAPSVDPSRLAVWETDGGRVGSSATMSLLDASVGDALSALVVELVVGRDAARNSTSRPLGVCSSSCEHGVGDTRMLASGEVGTALAEAKADLLRTHHGVLEDPRNDVEGLDGAGCSSYIEDLARLAMGADAEGLSHRNDASRLVVPSLVSAVRDR